MAVAATSATVASFTGLRGLALLTGWPDGLAWLLPVTVDAYAMTSARVWLAPGHTPRAARRFARANGLGAISASITGNAAYHAVQAGLLEVSWPIIVLVGAVPATVLGLTAHLHALRGRTEDTALIPAHPALPVDDAEPVPERDPEPPPPSPVHEPVQAPDSGPSPEPIVTAYPSPELASPVRSDEQLFAAALSADQEYRNQYGRPITRDALRTQLHVSNSRATGLRRRLHEHHASTPGTGLVPEQRTASLYGMTKSIVPE